MQTLSPFTYTFNINVKIKFHSKLLLQLLTYDRLSHFTEMTLFSDISPHWPPSCSEHKINSFSSVGKLKM